MQKKEQSQTWSLQAETQRVNSYYACARRTRGLGGRTAPQSWVFPGSASSPLESARILLPYLICLRPSPFLYVFRFLVGASWSQPRQWVCVWRTPSGPRPGTPAPPPPRPRGCGTNVCPSLAFSSPSCVAQRCAANGLSAARCPTRLSGGAGLSRLPGLRPGPRKGRVTMAFAGTSFLSAFPRRFPWFLCPGEAGQSVNVEASFRRGEPGAPGCAQSRAALSLCCQVAAAGVDHKESGNCAPFLYITSIRRVSFPR